MSCFLKKSLNSYSYCSTNTKQEISFRHSKLMTEARQYLTLLFTLATHITRHAIKVKDIYLSVSEQSTLRIHKHAHTHSHISFLTFLSQLNSTSVAGVSCRMLNLSFITLHKFVQTHLHIRHLRIVLAFFYYLLSFLVFMSPLLSRISTIINSTNLFSLCTLAFIICVVFLTFVFFLCAHQSYSFFIPRSKSAFLVACDKINYFTFRARSPAGTGRRTKIAQRALYVCVCVCLFVSEFERSKKQKSGGAPPWFEQTSAKNSLKRSIII